MAEPVAGLLAYLQNEANPATPELIRGYVQSLETLGRRLPKAGGKPALGRSRFMLKGLLAGITNAILPKTKPDEAERLFAELALQHNPRFTEYNPYQSN